MRETKYGESQLFLGKVPGYESYINSTFILSEVEKERNESNLGELNNKLEKENKWKIVTFYGTAYLLVLSLVITGFIAMFNLNGLEEHQTQGVWGFWLVGGLLLTGAVTGLASHYLKNKAKETQNNIDQHYPILTLKGVREGRYVTLANEVKEEYDEYRTELEVDLDLNTLVEVEVEGKKGITRVYNILGVYDNGRVFNKVSFSVLDSEEAEELKHFSKEEYLGEDQLIKVLAMRSIMVNGENPSPKSNYQKRKDVLIKKYNNDVVNKLGLLKYETKEVKKCNYPTLGNTLEWQKARQKIKEQEGEIQWERV